MLWWYKFQTFKTCSAKKKIVIKKTLVALCCFDYSLEYKGTSPDKFGCILHVTQLSNYDSTYQELDYLLHMDTRCSTIQVKQFIWTEPKMENPISTVGGALKSSSFSSYFAFCRPHQSLVPTLTQNWTLSWSFLNQILIRLILIQMTPVSAAALWGVACSSSIPSGSLWYRQDQWRWRNWWRTLCSLDDPWGRLTRRNLAC